MLRYISKLSDASKPNNHISKPESFNNEH